MTRSEVLRRRLATQGLYGAGFATAADVVRRRPAETRTTALEGPNFDTPGHFAVFRTGGVALS